MVKITFKTLQQKQFFIEAEPTETILDVKKKIQQDQGFDVASQKIIFSGKILTDDKTVGDANFKEKDFCVVMVSKPKAQPAPAATPAAVPSTPAQAPPSSAPNAPGPAAAAAAASSPSETPSQSTNAPATVPDTVAPAAGGSGNEDPTSFLMGSALETSVNEMVSMGFPKDQVMRAMRASFNNPHRAVEYLMNGIPESSNQDAPPSAPPAQAPGTPSPAGANAATAQPLAQTPAPAAPAPATNAPRNLFEAAAAASRAPNAAAGSESTPTGAGGGSSEMAQIASQPIFAQLRSLVQQNPALLQPFLQQLGASNPELLSIIDRNQQEFVQFLQEGAEGGEGDDDDDLGDLMGQFGGGGEGGAAGGEQYIQVSEEEKAAIERLCAMGFDRQMVIQAYLACDRNEELAANYLLEHGFDFDD